MTYLTLANAFFAFARERYLIHLRRKGGQSFPWTQDPVLREFRFCNVFREDDKVTIWFRENVREPKRNSPTVIFATTAFRFFNTIATGERLKETGLLEAWDGDVARRELADLHPLITGAYMVKTPLRKPKLEGLIEILDPVWAERFNLTRDLQAAGSLEKAHERMMRFPWIGPFMAYEIVTDLRHTAVLKDASDKYTWANPGPGAMRGLSWVVHGTTEQSMPREEMLSTMQALLYMARQHPEHWPREWPEWEMREVEHVLCEFDKYMRTVSGQGRPKQLYKPERN